MGIFKTLGIGIVSFRRPQRILDLVKSIENNTRRPYRLFIYDNFSCQKTVRALKALENEGRATVIWGDENAGPYTAYNALFEIFWHYRNEIPYFAKMDDDCVVTKKDWDDVMLAPFFNAPEKIRECLALTTCRQCNCGFPVENGLVRQVKSEFFMMRTDLLHLIGTFIDETADGFRPAYSMDSEWMERVGRFGRGIYLVDDVYAAPQANTFNREEYFPGERARLDKVINESGARWGFMEQANIKHFQRPENAPKPTAPWRPGC